MAANFNNSAWFYDPLARLVYGRALIDSQTYLLQYVPKNANILVIGGGTGWILEEIRKIHSSGLKITYVEVAPGMIRLSKKRDKGNNQVTFITNAIENISLPNDFDIIITPFLFDNFTEQTLQKVFNHIQPTLKPGGLWLNASFQITGKWWQIMLLKIMFIFFRIICNVEASELPEIEKQFGRHGYCIISEKTFFYDFIISRVFRK